MVNKSRQQSVTQKRARKPAGRKAPARPTTAITRARRSAPPVQPVERYGLIELGGKPATVIGEDVKIGDQAPEFSAQAGDWAEARPIESTTGKVRIVLALPSVSTDVCDRELRRFIEAMAALSEDILLLAVSADLPPTQRTWCAARSASRIMMVSDHMEMEFGLKYGCWIKERRWLRRAAFVVDRGDQVVYAAYMPGLGVEPNYAEVLAAAEAAL